MTVIFYLNKLQAAMTKTAGIDKIYIHFPFCRELCGYCDFFSRERNTCRGFIKKFPDLISGEYSLYKDICRTGLSTLYFGGGTPLAAGYAGLQSVFSIFKNILHKNTEITLETNPLFNEGAARSDWENLLAKIPKLRISAGIQSFDLSELEHLGRNKIPDPAFLDFLKKNASELSLDFIFASGSKRLLSLKKDIIKALALKPAHLSFYGLEGSRLHSTASEKDFLSQYRYIITTLKKSGYRQYEISNFSLPGHECRHNLNYWQNGHYLGLGPGACGYIHKDGKDIRYSNHRNFSLYQKCLQEGKMPWARRETINSKTREFEFLFLALRTGSGISLKKYRSIFKDDFFRKYVLFIKKHTKFLIIDRDRICLNFRGLCLYNEIASDLYI
ncbi:MAG: hypothetical protein A2096_16185 [Spirochaetes bacterium GWF1_41_5]|nr:MAG: hypothetical protein A2096_16185 [Spirochaetes bacterium GWF1_41_5]HBE04378.1 hypothetical protein [Spirochaetia bacterium]